MEKILSSVLWVILTASISESSPDSRCFGNVSKEEIMLKGCTWKRPKQSAYTFIYCGLYFYYENITADVVGSDWAAVNLVFYFNQSEKQQDGDSPLLYLKSFSLTIDPQQCLNTYHLDSTALPFCPTAAIFVQLITKKMLINVVMPSGVIAIATLQTKNESVPEAQEKMKPCSCIVEFRNSSFLSNNTDGWEVNPLQYMANHWRFYAENSTVNITWSLTDHIIALPPEISSLFAGILLQYFSMEESSLESLSEQFLPAAPILTVLTVAGNRIKKISPNLLLIFPKLKLLNLTRNYLDHIPLAIFNSPTLRILDISWNEQNSKYFALKKSSYTSSNITNLILTGTSLSYLPAGGFSYYPLLEKLNLSSCSIESIYLRAFEGNMLLKVLDLSQNMIKNLENGVFTNIKRLRVLHLQKNSISFKSTLPFASLTFLEYLDLNSNYINFIPNNLFQDLSSLRTLLLHNNRISAWKHQIFNIPQLEQLILSQNSIQYLNEMMIKDIQHIREVRLEANPWDCDSCDLPIFQKWIGREVPKTFHYKYYCSWTRLPVMAAVFKEKRCISFPPNYFLMVGLPIHVTWLSALGFAILIYKHRWYIRYFAFYLRLKVFKYQELNDTNTYEYDVFISYSSKDCKFAIRLLNKMENEFNLKVCIDERDFIPGTYISDNIVHSIDNSKTVIFVLSENFVKSSFCIFEMQMAQHRLFELNNALILIKYGNIPDEIISKKLKYLMKTRNYIEWREDPRSEPLFWLRLKNALTGNIPSVKDENFI